MERKRRRTKHCLSNTLRLCKPLTQTISSTLLVLILTSTANSSTTHLSSILVDHIPHTIHTSSNNHPSCLFILNIHLTLWDIHLLTMSTGSSLILALQIRETTGYSNNNLYTLLLTTITILVQVVSIGKPNSSCPSDTNSKIKTRIVAADAVKEINPLTTFPQPMRINPFLKSNLTNPNNNLPTMTKRGSQSLTHLAPQ